MFDLGLDAAGFPVIHVPDTNLFVSWLPFTKIQLEHFIAATNHPDFDLAHYNHILSYNPRISASEMDLGKYEGVFVTGILPAEARIIAQWMGNNYDLPTASEWKTFFNYFHGLEASASVIDQIRNLEGISERASTLITRLDSLTYQERHQLLGDTRRVCDQMLLRLGIMEYVYEGGYRSTYAGQGMPNRAFHPHTRSLPRDGQETLRDDLRENGGRIKQYGFRLIQRR